MSSNYKIGVFDSGIGGLTVLQEIKRALPNENILYYGDSKNNPYGNKSDEKLWEITKKIVNYLKEKQCKVIVIACNTATTRCIKKLREEFPELVFVGTEPAIKMACDQGCRETLVMGTKATVTSKSVHHLIHKNKKENQNIYLQNCEGLAHAIETNNQRMIHELLDRYLTPYQNQNFDSVVLGCTHYPLIQKQILEYFKDAKIYDGAQGVAREVKHQLEMHNLYTVDTIQGKVTILNSIEDSL